MAMLSSAFHTFGATGIREDLADFIENISPTDTPCYNSIGSTKATNTKHEWQTDKLAAAAANAKLEGDIFTNLVAAVTPTDRLNNNTQIFTKAFTITTTMDAVNTAGRAKESSYQMSKAMKSLKNDFEFCLFDNAATATGDAGSTTAGRRMKTLARWVTSFTATTGASGFGEGGTSTCTVITEAAFNGILQNIWNEGGKPNAVYVGGNLKRLVSGWGTSTSRVWSGDKKIVNAVDIYESDFGVLSLKLERYSNSAIGYILDESLWAKAVLTPTKLKPLGSRGLGDDFLIHSEWTVEARNVSGNGCFGSAP